MILPSLTRQAFLLPSEHDKFEVDLNENKIRGIGQFGLQSYLIFCKDGTVNPKDKVLQSFCRWREKQREKPITTEETK